MSFSEKPQIYFEAREQHNKHDFRIHNADLAQTQKSILLTSVHMGKEGLEVKIDGWHCGGSLRVKVSLFNLRLS